jgi:DEAD/DEAH box helicase domain-containing protein
MPQPDYSNLLQTLWYPTQSSPVQPDSVTIDPAPDSTLHLSDYLGGIAWEETFPSQAAEFVPLPSTLPKALRSALIAQGITQLYSHQAKTYRAVRAGKDVVLTVPTAAGKTLAAYIPVLEGAIASGHNCLSLYGLKALASDQSAKLESLLGGMPKVDRPRFVTLTGDVNRDQRKALLATEPSLVAITPDLLHWELNQVYWSKDWQQFLASLRYVVLDELHSYSGVFGANLHWLIQRLKRSIDTCGGDSAALQFICLSATVGNPKELASRLIGRPIQNQDGSKRLVSIHRSGAARSTKRLVVCQPSPNANAEAAKAMVFLMRQGLRGITFCNAIGTTKHLVGLVENECRLQGCPQLQGKVASFYGSLEDDRRQRIISDLESNRTQWIVATSALEAGIDLPQLDVAIVLGFPGTLMSFQQRIGRCGRQNQGLAIYLPRAQALLDGYFSQRDRLLAPCEPVHFNPNYPITIAKHLLCAAAESGIPPQQLQHYFGEAAEAVAQGLLNQGSLLRRKDGVLYTKAKPHGSVSLRGTIGGTSYKLIDVESRQQLETMPEDLAHRQVYPGAIYPLQDEQRQMQFYRSESLEAGVARLRAIPDSGLRTYAQVETGLTIDSPLQGPVSIPLRFPAALQPQLQLEREIPHLQLSLNFGTILHQVSGYQLESRCYERTCLNGSCVKHKTPLPGSRNCPGCGKRTREAELVQVIKTVLFDQPYVVQFQSPMLSLTLNGAALAQIEGFARDTKVALQDDQSSIRQYQALWDYPSHLVAIHSLGHQLMKALPLTVLHAWHDTNFICSGQGRNPSGTWFDTSDGGNGGTESILRYWDKLVPAALELARSCDCATGCPKCLSDFRCPDQNAGLLKQMGLFVLEALV